jgi:predicted HTH domain antitoxin
MRLRLGDCTRRRKGLMDVNFEIPQDVAAQLRSAGTDLNRLAKESLLVESFRRGLVTHAQLAQALGLDRFETDELLQRHRIYEQSLTMEDLESDRRNLEQVLKAHGR